MQIRISSILRVPGSIVDDDHPLLLIDGLRVAGEAGKELAPEGIRLGQFLKRGTEWHNSYVSHSRPERILSQDRVGSPAWPHRV